MVVRITFSFFVQRIVFLAIFLVSLGVGSEGLSHASEATAMFIVRERFRFVFGLRTLVPEKSFLEHA